MTPEATASTTTDVVAIIGTTSSVLALIVAILACFLALKQLRIANVVASTTLLATATSDIQNRLSDYKNSQIHTGNISIEQSEWLENFYYATLLNCVEVYSNILEGDALRSTQKTILEIFIIDIISSLEISGKLEVKKLIHSPETFIHITKLLSRHKEKRQIRKRAIAEPRIRSTQ